MKLNKFSTIFFAFFALLSACTALATPLEKGAPPPPSNEFTVDHPEEGLCPYHCSAPGGSTSEIFKRNPDVKLSLQTAIPLPDVNIVVVDSVRYRSLAVHGVYFAVKQEYLSTRPNARYRVRASFFDTDGKQHYVDSRPFHTTAA
ncbi:hypothetical protein BGZ47_003694 [Haplosporangium gracile]|nr:hypothetical protein BGZ47_003694 [Haplosporangium gracile]